MAEFGNDNNKVSGVFGGVQFDNNNKEIKVELTPAQQKVEDEINEFLHQEITWGKVHDFLFQEVTFGK